jgi:SNF2 family DNA or RNA helicase
VSLKLHTYQVEAVNFIKNNNEVAVFGDCGIGKTIICLQAISDLLLNFEAKGVLIIAPLRVARMTWPLEILERKEFNWLKYSILHGVNKEKNFNENSLIYIINYEGLTWLDSILSKMNYKNWPFDVVIYDELTKMKNPSSKRFKRWRKFVKFFNKRIGLTGTPTANGYLDLWAQFFCLDIGESLGQTFTSYRNRFFYQTGYQGYQYKVRDRAEQEIQNIISPVTLRISSKDYLNLPDLNFEDIELSMPERLMEQYKTLENELFVELDKENSVEAVNAAVLSNKCLQFASGSIYLTNDETQKRYVENIHDIKINALKKIVKTTSQPILVGYSFKHELEKILKHFPYALTLSSKDSQNEELTTQKLWNEGKIKMLVCHPAAVAHGLNLQNGSNIGVWFSLNWSLELYQQFIARLWRQGQNKPVTFYRLIMKDTIDEAVATALESKSKSQTSLLQALNLYRQNR